MVNFRPPGIFMTSNLVAKTSFIIIWGPILRAVLKNRGSANQSKMDHFEKFSTISCTKCKLKGGQFNEKKMPTLVFWVPYYGPFWTYWGVDCKCPGPSLHLL